MTECFQNGRFYQKNVLKTRAMLTIKDRKHAAYDLRRVKSNIMRLRRLVIPR